MFILFMLTKQTHLDELWKLHHPDPNEEIDETKINQWTCPDYVTKYVTRVTLEWGSSWWTVDHVSDVCDIFKKMHK